MSTKKSGKLFPIRRKRSKYSFRAFYITTCLLSALAVLSILAYQITAYRYGNAYYSEQTRAAAQLDVDRLLKRDEECRLVHFADDKCAFIRANCPDEEAGLISYLSLYYCGLSKAKPLAFLILVLWLSLLFSMIGIAASDFFCINLSTIASILGMSESMAGVTFLAFGNGSPDVFSTFAAMNSNSGSLAIGELIGAAGFITAVVAGSMALVREFKVGKKSFVRDIGFFIVAVSFSMIFLSDGALRVWECIAMIGFYIFYVAVVVVWHWVLSRRQKQRKRLTAAHGHHYSSNDVEIEVQEEYHDEEVVPSGNRTPIMSRQSTGDWANLENGPRSPYNEDDYDNEGPEGVRLATEMSNSMRVLNPSGRKNTLNTIRPSLVGAMEFRAVLSSLQKSRNTQFRPIHMRRYSDDAMASSTHTGNPPTPSPLGHDPLTASRIIVTAPDDEQLSHDENFHRPSVLARTRAHSTSNMLADKKINPAAFSVANIPTIGFIGATPTFPPPQLNIPSFNAGIASSTNIVPVTSFIDDDGGDDSDDDSANVVPTSPTISVTNSPSDDEHMDITRNSSALPGRQNAPRLAPPRGIRRGRPTARSIVSKVSLDSPLSGVSPMTSPTIRPTLTIPARKKHNDSPLVSPIRDFPTYTDNFVESPTIEGRRLSVLELPEPRLSRSNTYTTDLFDSTNLAQPVLWWPYRWLPDPYVMLATFFPTLNTWRDKSIIDKFISIASVPSIFLLAITLPVVESDSEDSEDDSSSTVPDLNGPATGASSHHRSKSISSTPALALVEDEQGEWRRYRRATLLQRSRSNSRSASPSPLFHGLTGHANAADVAISTEHHQHHRSHGHYSDHGPSHDHSYSSNHLEPPKSPAFPFPDAIKLAIESSSDAPVESTDPVPDAYSWNRWLVITQMFTAPFFMAFIIWANTEGPTDDPHNLPFFTRLVVYSMIFSIISVTILLLTTSAYHPPRYRFLLCFLGFIVAIAWIATIANEVVGILKAFGVILDISDAILGLTIFAVGNSLGDLIADITVARLGYPVMALSACFGGPMLNILIGIGVSGLYCTIKDANHKHAKHPHKDIRYKPYEIEVSHTLMISACALLVTLVGLLFVVPLNGWCMNRRIGFGLITLWVIGVLINLTVEVTGILS